MSEDDKMKVKVTKTKHQIQAERLARKDAVERIDMAQLLVNIGFSDVDPNAEQQLLYCVFHNDQATPSFSANLNKKIFNCFSSACGIHGNAISLYALWRQIPYEQALQEIQYLPKFRDVDRLKSSIVRPHVTVSPSLYIRIRTDFIKAMPKLYEKPFVDSEYTKYLTGRGLSLETIRRYDFRMYSESEFEKLDKQEMTYAGIADAWGRCVFRRHPILFPFWINNYGVAYIQGRAFGEDPNITKYMGCRGTVPCLYNHGALTGGFKPERVFLCEGVLDAVSMSQMGFFPTFGIVGTEGFKDSWSEDFRGVKEVWIATDNDDAGNAAYSNLAPLFQSVMCYAYRFVIPSPHKDANSWLLSKIQ